MLEADKKLFLLLNGLHSSASDTFWLLITSNWAWLLLFLPMTYFAWKKLGKFIFIPAICVALLFLLADQGTNLAKAFFERPRPCREETIQGLVHFIAPRCSLYGFWSAHAANSFAQITFFMLSGIIPKNLRHIFFPYLLLFGIIVSLSRIMVGVHYPGDIFAGAIFGILCGLLGIAIYRLALRKVWQKQ